MIGADTIVGRALISLILVIGGYILMRLGGKAYLKFMQIRRRKTIWPEEVWSGSPVLLYFSTLQCAVCKYQQAKCITQVKEELNGRGVELDVRKFDAAERADIAKLLGVVTVPTTVILDGNGQIAAFNTGLCKKNNLAEQLNQVYS